MIMRLNFSVQMAHNMYEGKILKVNEMYSRALTLLDYKYAQLVPESNMMSK